MAFRIHESVVRGEIDNREKGIVRGRIWLHRRAEPIVLELTGNAHPDLAGCLLQFKNQLPPVDPQNLDGFNALQRGGIGDLTASRKVRVFDVPVARAMEMIEGGEKPPEHTANCLYLEWFSEANGRVVIESADYELEISPPLWRLTPEENQQRARQAESGMSDFLKKLTEAVEAQRQDRPPDLEDWDEFDHEKALRESDAITDKYIELLEKYGDSPEADERIAKEMGWRRDEEKNRDDADDPPIDVDELNSLAAAEENLQPDPLTEGVDWTKAEDGDIRHPLSHRALESTITLMNEMDELGLEDTDEADVVEFVGEYQITSAKLAGALDSLAYGRDIHGGTFVVAYLKRALDHLHKSQSGLEKTAAKDLLPAALTAKYRQELFEIREEILRLMQEFRGK